MKKVTLIMALAVGAGLASCTAQSPKANLKKKLTHCLMPSVWLYRRLNSVSDATRC